MRQLVISSPGVVELREAETPEPGPGEILVLTMAVGICGSDLHALAGAHPFITLPCVPGHEVVGVVGKTGEGVTGLKAGMRVILEPNLVCGQCPYCRSGRYNVCERLRVVGCQTAGAMADAFTAPANRFHVIPDSLTDAQAALAEPLSTAVHAVRMAGQLAGAAVAVLGGGTIGLLTLIAAVRAGARAVAVSEPRESKRRRALRLGAAFCADPLTADPVPAIREALGGHADVTFDCVSSQASTVQAIRLAENGGTVMVVGVAAEDVTIPLSIIQDREIRLAGSAMYVRQDVLRAIDLMSDGVVPAGELVTATLPLAEGAQAFKRAASGDDVKVHLYPARA
jgi:2-desacetyl-2-hydroxyethyl bacteriochlorophyllide A dehydrogenase